MPAVNEAKLTPLEEIEWLLTDYTMNGEGAYSRRRALDLAATCRDWLGIKRDPITLAITKNDNARVVKTADSFTAALKAILQKEF